MMFSNSPIRMEWFFDIEGEKTKLNWYLLEIALEYYGRLIDSPELAHYREQHDKNQIALFCAYYARRLKESLLKYLRGQRKTVIFYQHYVSDYYPQHSDHLTRMLSREGKASFDNMWSECRVCPQQCLCVWEYEERNPLFDEYQG